MNPEPPSVAPDAATPGPSFVFDNSYARELDGCHLDWQPARVPAPRLVRLNRSLAEELGWDPDWLASPAGVDMLAGNRMPSGARPIAQAYAGHQFGQLSPQLGDGRALLIGEVIDRFGRRRDIAFKGSGRTPFSRGGDGKAALGPVLREFLIGEAMHALGIPTTRALAAVATGEPVYRDATLPGAILTRVASSHLRVGTFQYFAIRHEHDTTRRLADHAIARHDPDLIGRSDRYLGLLRAVAWRQAHLVARWMGVGFIHGVMNTDNMTISGETIDYGPCAFMETHDPAAVFSSIDLQGRYAFGNQPAIARWNLARFAETLLPLIHESADEAIAMATEVIDAFPNWYSSAWLGVLRDKLGLDDQPAEAAADLALGEDFQSLLRRGHADHTLGYRRLIDSVTGHDAPLLALIDPALSPDLDAWLARWRRRLAPGPGPRDGLATDSAGAGTHDAITRMRRANPIYIARNHQVEAALSAAIHDDLRPFDRLLAALRSPFDERVADADLAQPAPADVTARYLTFCGT